MRGTPGTPGWGLVALLAGASLTAQTHLPSEIMPLAAQSLLLDVTLAGDRAVAVGERGHILLSDDYGRSWRQAGSPTRATLTSVTFADPLNGWAAGHDNVILHTSDGGQTWRHQYPAAGPDTRILDALFLDRQRGIAVGAYGIAFTTRNGGERWSSAEFFDEELHFNRITKGPDGRLYLALEAGELLVSGDEGESWESLDSPYAGSLFGILPLTARTLLAYGLRGHVFRSTDGGETWTEAQVPVHVLIMNGLRLSWGPVVLAGQNGQFLVSEDGGRSFEVWRVPVQGATSLAECPDGSILAVGLNGVHRLTPPKPRTPRQAP